MLEIRSHGRKELPVTLFFKKLVAIVSVTAAESRAK